MLTLLPHDGGGGGGCDGNAHIWPGVCGVRDWSQMVCMEEREREIAPRTPPSLHYYFYRAMRDTSVDTIQSRTAYVYRVNRVVLIGTGGG